MNYTNGLAKEEFLQHMFEEFPNVFDNTFSRTMLENIVDYGTANNFTHTKNVLYYFLMDVIPEIEPKDLIPFMDRNMLTDEVLQEVAQDQISFSPNERKEMDPSYFRIPQEALSVARKMLDPDCPEPYYILRPQFMNSIPADKECFLGIDYEAKERQIPAADVLNEKDYITVFDPGDNVVAVISTNEVLHKEDFAVMMKASGMDATEENFNKVWASFPDRIPDGFSLKDVAKLAIETTMFEIRDNKKLSLSNQIQFASIRAAGPLFSEKAPVKESTPER